MINIGGITVRAVPVALAAGLVFAFGGCSGEPGTEASAASSEFSQSWTKAYSETTCAEYKSQMTPDQQRVMAADMLVSARSVDKVTTMPSDEMIGTFRDGPDNRMRRRHGEDERDGRGALPHGKGPVAGLSEAATTRPAAVIGLCS